MHDETQRNPDPAVDVDDKSARGGSLRIRSEQLFRGAREILIEHDGRQYQLRITQNGKLILTA
jgi:hemin uptake protein HemP